MKTPSSNKPKDHSRADDKTTMSISLPARLKAQWDAAAAANLRSSSNLFCLVAEQYLQSLGHVAEDPETYGAPTPAKKKTSTPRAAATVPISAPTSVRYSNPKTATNPPRHQP